MCLVPADGKCVHDVEVIRRIVCFSPNVFVQRANNRSLSLRAPLCSEDKKEEGTGLEPLFARSAKNHSAGRQSRFFLGIPAP